MVQKKDYTCVLKNIKTFYIFTLFGWFTIDCVFVTGSVRMWLKPDGSVSSLNWFTLKVV